jgi:membrane protease YdiL (CAAX protease family)
MKQRINYLAYVPFLAIALSLQTIAAISYYSGIFAPAINQALYTATKIGLLVIPLIFWWAFMRQQPDPFLRFRLLPATQRMRTALQGVGIGLIAAIIIFIAYLFSADYLTSLAPQLQEKAAQLGLNTLPKFIVFSLFLSLIHSLLEEYYWRWFAFAALHRITPTKIAHTVAAMAFAAHHFVILYFMFSVPVMLIFGLPIIAMAVFWSYSFEKTGNLLIAWISHIIIDLIIMAIGGSLIFG